MAVILTADDDPDIRMLVARILMRDGHRVVQVADGQAALDTALAAADTAPFDLVILDNEMPRLRGLDACRQLRDHPRTRHVPVVIASGSLVPPYDDVSASGATACLAKPFTPAQLREIVDAQLASPVAG